MDVDLPVWTIRPNWANGVLERLEWLTDVLPSETGVEQRRSVRVSPRRSFEITVNPTRAERTYLDLALHRLGSEEWLFPVWHDQATLGADVVIGATALTIDNTFREFVDDGYAILYRSAFEWEVVQISTQTAEGLTISATTKAWSKGTKVYPLLRCTLPADTDMKAVTSRTGESVLLFTTNEANDYPEMLGDAMASYQGSPLLLAEPNRSEEITLNHTRMSDEADGQVGLRYRVDTAGRAFSVQSHNWMIQGREGQAAFRSFLYTLRGRQRMVWLPSFNDDLFVARPIAAGATRADIEQIGLGYVGGGSPIPGRTYFWTGTEVLQHASMQAALGVGEERLGLLTATQAAYAAGAAWSFLTPARLDQDMIELHHHTDSDGVMECSAGFHTFANDRVGTGSNFVPIPAAAMSPVTCGSPIGLNPCAKVFPGWYHKMIHDAYDPCNTNYDPTRLLGHPVGLDGSSDNLGTGFSVPASQRAADGSLRYEVKAIDNYNGRMSWEVYFYYPIKTGSWGETVQYPAFFCGSVGKGEHLVRISMQNWDQDGPSVVVDRWSVGGNYPYSINWTW